MSNFLIINKKVDFGPFWAWHPQNDQIWSFVQKSGSVTFLHFCNLTCAKVSDKNNERILRKLRYARTHGRTDEWD